VSLEAFFSLGTRDGLSAERHMVTELR